MLFVQTRGGEEDGREERQTAGRSAARGGRHGTARLYERNIRGSLGKHYNSIIRLKQEQSTTLPTLELLCEKLNCHPFDLIVAEGFPEPFLVAPVSH